MSGLSALSDTQRRLLELLAKGRSAAEAADVLDLELSTVAAALEGARQQLGVSSTSAAIAAMLRRECR